MSTHSQQSISRLSIRDHRAIRDYRFSAKRGGHAPGHLRNALIEALEAPARNHCRWYDNLNIVFYSARKRRWWGRLEPRSRGKWLIGQLWNCTDTIPGDIRSAIEGLRSCSYASLARFLKAEMENADAN